jgi:hypothetical protein
MCAQNSLLANLFHRPIVPLLYVKSLGDSVRIRRNMVKTKKIDKEYKVATEQ